MSGIDIAASMQHERTLNSQTSVKDIHSTTGINIAFQRPGGARCPWCINKMQQTFIKFPAVKEITQIGFWAAAGKGESRYRIGFCCRNGRTVIHVDNIVPAQ